ncbi:MAG: Ig-like domain-containing protein, partial [Chloroflexota bacterium]
MHGWRAVMLTGAMLALALAFPGLAAAAPACPAAVALGDVHTGASVHGDVTCDDPSATGLTYTVVGGGTTTGGFATTDGVGGVDYTADSDSFGSDAFTVQVDDNEGGTASIDVTVQVVDQAPVCQPVHLGTVPRNQPAAGTPDCTDPDADPLTYAVTQPVHGTADSFDDLEYTPDAGFTGADQFTYTASDGARTSAAATVDVTVQNNAPTCDPDGQTLRTGKPIQLSLSCSDLDGDPLTLTVATAPAHGTLGTVTADGFGGASVTYTPAGTYTGADSFTFRASDGDKQSAPVTFALTITPNHAPACEANGAFHTRVNTPLTLFVFCSDEDAQDAQLTYTAVGGAGPAHGTLGPFDGSQVSYTPATGYTGTDQFGVRASDGTLDDTTDVPLHVANGPLCSTPSAAIVRAGHSRELAVDCTQPDDVFTALQYEIVSAPTKGQLDSADASFDSTRTYTANAAATGADSYSIRAVSGANASPAVVQAITTGNVNNPPVCDESGGATQVYAGRPGRLFPSCFDLDQDSLTYTAPTQPAHGTSSVSNNQLTYLAGAGYTGTDSVPYTAADGHGGSASSAIPVDVFAPERPTCVQGPITATVRPGGATTLELDCFSPQDDPQSYSVVSAPSKGSLGSFDQFGEVTYTAAANATGQDTFSLRAGNAVGDSDVQTVTITVDPAFNRAPECDANSFHPEHVVTHTATPLKLGQVCSDPDGDPLVFVRKSQPTSGGTLTAGPAATLSYTSPAGFVGADDFTFVARDDRGTESPVTAHTLDVVTSIAPTCTQHPPLSLRPGQSRTVSLDCQDVDDNPITYRIVSGPASGTLAPSGDSTDADRTYTAPGTAGDGSFTYRATSSGGDSAVYTQTITVDPNADQAPTCVPNAGSPQRVAQQRATQLAISDRCDDADDDPLTFTRVTPNPQHGTATASAGKITYTSAAGYTGTDTIGYQAADGHGGTTTGTFTVDVEPVTPPACATPDDVSVRPSRTADVTFDCTDAFDSAIGYHIVSAPALGTLDPAGDGPDDFRTYHAGAASGTDTFSYQATSENGTSTTVTQTVHVTASANSAPVCSANSGQAQKVAAGHARTLDPDCADGDDDSLTYHKLGEPGHGTLSDAGGTLVYTPANGFVGQDSFNYDATDGHGGTSAPTAFFV